MCPHGLHRAINAAAIVLTLLGVSITAREEPPALPPPGPAAPLAPHFPRLATIYSKGDGQDTVPTQTAISRFNLYVADMINWPARSAEDPSTTQGRNYKRKNPSLIALMYFHSCIYSDTEYTAGQFTIGSTRYYIDPAWYLTYAGSTLAEDVPASARSLPVRELSSFADGDRVMLGGVRGQSRAELATVTAKSAPAGPGVLTVTRGVLSQGGKLAATSHAAGDYVRPVAHAFGAGPWMVLNVTATAAASSVNASLGPQTWNQFVASFLARKLDDPAFGNVDGYLLDNFVDRATALIDHPERVDLYNTNTATGLPGSVWSDGMRDLASQVRSNLPRNTLMVANSGGQASEAFGPYLNGGMIEGLDEHGTSAMEGGLAESLAFYRAWSQHARRPPLFIVNGSPQVGSLKAGEAAYQAMRFLLTLTLTGDGYFVFDELNIDGGHQTIWWYDEYDNAGQHTGYLGQAFGPATQPLPGVYRRDFAHGISVSNTTSSVQTVNLGGIFRKIRGRQAPTVNDGSRVTSVRLAPRDGLILLRN
jgi:hypothetical protein